MPSCHHVSDFNAQRVKSPKSYLEFLRTRTLSTGLYVLRAGEEDLQRPHAEDEVYYVIRGRAQFRAGGENWSIRGGSVLFVEAGLEHRFHEIVEDLTVLVFFAPPEGTSQNTDGKGPLQ